MWVTQIGLVVKEVTLLDGMSQQTIFAAASPGEISSTLGVLDRIAKVMHWGH